MENNLIQATVDYVHNLDWSDIFTNITSNKLLFLLSIAIPVIIPLFNIYKRIELDVSVTSRSGTI